MKKAAFICMLFVLFMINPAMAQKDCPKGQEYSSLEKKCLPCEKFGRVWEEYPTPVKGGPSGYCDCGPCREESSDGCRYCHEFRLPCDKNTGKCVRTPGNDGHFEYSREISKGATDSLAKVKKMFERWEIADYLMQPGQTLDRAFCYCECRSQKGVFLWAIQNGPESQNLASKLSEYANRECGGCLNQPVVKYRTEKYEDPDNQ